MTLQVEWGFSDEGANHTCTGSGIDSSRREQRRGNGEWRVGSPTHGHFDSYTRDLSIIPQSGSVSWLSLA